MDLTIKDFYSLFCNHKFKKVSETIQDGISGMYFVLRILSETEREFTAGDISQMLGVSTARTAVILATLKKKGYIIKKKSAEDARKTIVSITPKGEKALQERKLKIFETIDSFLFKLDQSEKITFYNILKKILYN